MQLEYVYLYGNLSYIALRSLVEDPKMLGIKQQNFVYRKMLNKFSCYPQIRHTGSMQLYHLKEMFTRITVP